MNKSAQVAAKIYTSTHDKNQDTGYVILSALNVLKESNIHEVLEYYISIKTGKLKIAEITTAEELSASDQEKVEERINSFFGKNIIALFLIDKEILGGIRIKVNDHVLDETIKRKISEIAL
jgi:F0F1-type ATP synthase delta subunit